MIALCAFFAPTHIAEAKKQPKPPAVIGGFTVGDTFTFNVVVKQSSSLANGVTNANAPIPKGLPVFAMGQAVTFKIGKKGELLAPKVNIPFKYAVTGANGYLGKVTKAGPPPLATVVRDLVSGSPTRVELTYTQIKVNRRPPYIGSTYSLTYTLQ